MLTSNWIILFICCCLAQETKDVNEQLMDLMRSQLISVTPDDRESFVELCIKKRMQCTEKQFSGWHAVFTWVAGVSTEAKERFWHTYFCVYKQDINKCPVDGGWTEWSVWTKCNADCEDKGTQVRTRTCENPKPEYGGQLCQGETMVNRTCIGICRTNSDGLPEAEEYLVQVHEAFPDLAGLCMQKHCLYSEVLRIIKDRSKVDRYWSSINCVKYGSACPINGGWSDWMETSSCSVQCGIGEHFRQRKCDKPVTKNGGIPCQGEWFVTTPCVEKKCNDPNAYLTDWSQFSPCSESCGKYGVKTSTRYCLRKSSKCAYLGQNVEEVVRTEPCYGGACPQIGGWGQWLAWSDCSADCGIGRKMRFRKCDSPYPNGGEGCFGIRIQTAACDGSMCIQLPKEEESETRRKRQMSSDWKPLAAEFIVKNVNLISALQPQNGSLVATKRLHASYKITKTNNYTTYFLCNSVNKGPNHLPGNSNCLVAFDLDKPLIHKRSSNANRTARKTVNHNSTSVRILSDSGGILNGFMKFEDSLSISNITAIGLGHIKIRKNREVQVDQDDPNNFELNPALENTYTLWTLWSACSASCGGGTRNRTRGCKDKTIVCRGEIKATQFCNLDLCPVQGGWGAWDAWTPCNTLCGPGIHDRYRRCDNPLPAFGGSCAGSNKETKDCSNNKCIYSLWTWSDWSIWTACSATCNGGTRKRSSFLTIGFSPTSQRDEISVCNPQACPENGLWAAWGGWTPCSEPCGIGNRVRDRTCTDPAPNYGGAPCDGDGSDLQTCFAGPCLDEDDYGIRLEGTGFIRYADKGKATGFFMVFLRIKPVVLTGAIFHHTRECKGKLTNCDCSIMLTMTNGLLELEVKYKKGKKTVNLPYKNPLVADKWQDILVIVTESWAEMRVDDDYRAEKPFAPGSQHTFNFDGHLTIGNDRLGTNGFRGNIGALRKNFKILLMFNTKSWSGYAVPSVLHNVKKIQMKATVRHPDFRGRFYSHLFFYETHFFQLTASFLITETKGLMLFNGGAEPKSFLSVALVEASLQFCLSCGSNPICNKGYEMKTDEWYILHVVVKENEGQIRLNDGDAIQIMCPTGQTYQPRNSVYIGGSGIKDWNVIVEATTNQSMYHGLIDTLTIGGLVVTYKMATLIDVNGLLNSLGYSLSDYVTEVYKNEKSITSLLCAVPERTAKSHFVRIIWFENMRHMVPAAGVEIVDVESDTQVVSKVNLYPDHAGEGIYACVLSQDGILSVIHVFVVFRYRQGRREKRRIEEKEEVEYEAVEELNNQETLTADSKLVHNEDESESRAEWIVLIILLVLILLCFCPGLCYCCTKDHPMWIKPRNAINRIYAKITGTEYIEETELIENSESEPGESEGEGFLGESDASYDPFSEQQQVENIQLRSTLKRSQAKSTSASELQQQNQSQQQLLGQSQQEWPSQQQKGSKGTSRPPSRKPSSLKSSAPNMGQGGQIDRSTSPQCPPGFHTEYFYPIMGTPRPPQICQTYPPLIHTIPRSQQTSWVSLPQYDPGQSQLTSTSNLLQAGQNVSQQTSMGALSQFAPCSQQTSFNTFPMYGTDRSQQTSFNTMPLHGAKLSQHTSYRAVPLYRTGRSQQTSLHSFPQQRMPRNTFSQCEAGRSQQTSFTTYPQIEAGRSQQTSFTTYPQIEAGRSQQTSFTTYPQIEAGRLQQTSFTTYPQIEAGRSQQTSFTTYPQIEAGHSQQTSFTTYPQIEEGRSQQTSFTTFRQCGPCQPQQTASKTFPLNRTTRSQQASLNTFPNYGTGCSQQTSFTTYPQIEADRSQQTSFTTFRQCGPCQPQQTASKTFSLNKTTRSQQASLNNFPNYGTGRSQQTSFTNEQGPSFNKKQYLDAQTSSQVSQESFSKFHVSPSAANESVSRMPSPQEDNRQGRAFVCQAADDDPNEVLPGSRSQIKGRKFKCKVSEPQQQALGSQKPDFVDQIQVQIPSQRSFQTTATYPQTPCYFPHFPCKPSFNPYALQAPYNMNASIPPIDLLCNPYVVSQFCDLPCIDKERSIDGKKTSNPDLTTGNVPMHGSASHYMEDHLNFSENNSVTFYETSSEIFLQYHTQL